MSCFSTNIAFYRKTCVLCETSAQLIPIKTIKHSYQYIDNNGEYDMTYG